MRSLRPTLLPTVTTLLVASTLAASLTGCGASEPTADAATPQALTVGVVPSLELGLLTIAEEEGLLAEAGLELDIVPVDSGPNVITGVVSGQYDLGYTAYAPPLLAVAEGAPLIAVSSTGTLGPDGANGGTVVRSEAGYQRFADLSGVSLGTNAPRSLFSLTLPASVDADGGDGSDIELVPLPFNEIGQAVADGQVDAGVLLEPFLSQALEEYPDLVNLGDPSAPVLPQGSPQGLYLTSETTARDKAEAMAAFRDVLAEAIEIGNADLEAVKVAGAPLAGLDPELARALPLEPFDTTVSAESLQPLVDLMLEYDWITEAPDLTTFLADVQ
jgi:ABC-type nitrate/sulfonate/bicarbonate transport system substrate-binding protein